MILNSDITQCLKNIVDAAGVAKLENVALEKGIIRGIDDSKKVIVWHNTNVPDIPFTSLGINRFDVFSPRFNLVYSNPAFSVDAAISERDNCVSQLTMKVPGTKVDYRCANPKTLLLPKVNSDAMRFRVNIAPETIQFLTRCEAAMKVDFITFVSNVDGVRFEMVDNNGDVLTHTFDGQAENIVGEDDTTFVCRYPMRALLSLFKKTTESTFDVGRKGMLKVVISALDLYILPQV